MTQVVLHHTRQQVNAAAHVLWLSRNEDATHRRKVQHGSLRQAKAVDSRLPARSAGMPAENVQRRPLRVRMVNWR